MARRKSTSRKSRETTKGGGGGAGDVRIITEAEAKKFTNECWYSSRLRRAEQAGLPRFGITDSVKRKPHGVSITNLIKWWFKHSSSKYRTDHEYGTSEVRVTYPDKLVFNGTTVGSTPTGDPCATGICREYHVRDTRTNKVQRDARRR